MDGRGRASRRPDRGRRHLRDRRRSRAVHAPAGHPVRGARGAGGHRRHLGPLPLPRHPLRLGPHDVRLRVQALDRPEGHRRRGQDPRLPARDRRRVRPRAVPALPAPRRAGVLEQRRTPGGRSTSRTRRPARAPRPPATGSSRRAATTGTTGATPPRSRGSTPSRVRSCIRSTGRSTSTRAGKRVVVIGSGATAVTIVPALARDGAAVTMLQRTPTLRDVARLRGPLRRSASAACSGTEARPRPAAPPQHRDPAGALGALEAASRDGAPLHPQADRAAAAGGVPGRRALQPAVRPVGPAALLRPGRRPLPGDPGGRRRDGHRPHPCRHAGRDGARGRPHASRRTCSSPPPGSTCSRSVGSRSWSTARPMQLSDTVAYKGLMLSGVPNFAFAIGYTNASWTLKVGPRLRVLHPPARPYAAARIRGVRAAAAGRGACRRGRCSTSAPATCSGPSTGCRSRGRRCRGSPRRATRTTCGCCAGGRSRMPRWRSRRRPTAAARRSPAATSVAR